MTIPYNTDPLYTFTPNSSANGNHWNFGFHTLPSPQSSIPLNAYPTVNNITYNLVADTMSDNCTVPITRGASSSPCMHGTFHNTTFFPYNIATNGTASETPSSTTTGSDLMATYELSAALDERLYRSGSDPALISRLANQ
ncbi:hypothetical protein EIP86_001819 [Pleurotus ostreatoroseus]|nr:hypothetical protein EIP86_001819 [Pleurotus ostreatoroseus]